MDDLELESLAVKEIIEEIEKQKRLELESRRPPERKIRPNKRFLGRTIRSVLQHNRRQHARERHNSSRKLKELERRRHRSKSTSPSRSKKRKQNGERYSELYEHEVVQPEAIPNAMPMDLTMYFMNLKRMNHLLNAAQKVSKKHKKRKRSNILTIDLTKKKKDAKEKHKSRQKKTKSKKRRRRKDSSSSSSSTNSSNSVYAVSDSTSSSSDGDSQTSTLLIDLT